jgi:histidine triad (HIT) family protein
MDGDCYVCRKHRAMSIVPGGAIAQDEHAVVSHLPLTLPDRCVSAVYLGHLMVEPRRHVAGLGDLTPDEAASVGRLASAAAGALQRSEGAEHVDAAVIGEGVEHLHVQLVARYPGTPEDAPRGDAQAVIALAERLRRALA